MTHAQVPVAGYLDRLSARAGQEIAGFVSLRTPGPYRLRLERVVCGDPNPDGPGMRLDDLSNLLDRTEAGDNQPIRLGSYGRAAAPRRDPRVPATWTALIWPGATREGQALIADYSPTGFVELAFGPGGARATVNGTEIAVEGAAIHRRRWYRVWVSAGPADGTIVVGQQALDGTPAIVARTRVPGLTLPSGGGPLLLGARDAAAPRDHYSGKLEDPAILSCFVDSWSDPLDPAELARGDVVAFWDFSREMSTQTAIDTGAQGCHAALANLPTRAMAGARWSGREMCWRHAPRDYAAIHFHADDLGDCGWAESFRWTVPEGLRSGAYAFRVSTPDGEDRLPFYVLPPRGRATAPIAFLASTFTYQAYFNHSRGMIDESYRARVAAWGAYPHNPDDWPLYGRSMYNVHDDGAGIAFSSRRRPTFTMRPGFLTFDDPRGSGLRHYPADTHLLAWLDARGIEFDVLTDEDLDDEGIALLRPYRAILTGSHPEYHTEGTLDALAEYTRTGGRLAYLGGNGFYWRVARDKAMPWAIELRRTEGGVRTWAAEPAEYYHQLDGQYGGLWRRNRRPPQELAGVGFSGQGAFEGTYYRLLPAARDPAHAWIFDGIEGDILGDHGLSGGGAAGFELDRADTDLGTPYDAAILARSENPPASFFTVPEEVLAGRRTLTGERLEDLMRAEIVYFRTQGGGEVFSVGSITFCGSLWRGGWDGDVSRLLGNVVRRFSAP